VRPVLRRFPTSVALALVLAAAALAAPAPSPPAVPRPDFSGTWVLDTARTEFGNIPGGRWRARVDVIEHRDPALRQSLYMDNGVRRDTTHYVYNTAGRPVANRVDKQDITATVQWQGSDLRLVSKTRLMLIEMTLDETWRLSPDGRTLTMTRLLKYPLGEGRAKLVFTRR